MVRVTGLEAMLLSVPWVEELLHSIAAAASQLWAAATRMAGSGGSRDKRDAAQDQITQFIEQVHPTQNLYEHLKTERSRDWSR